MHLSETALRRRRIDKRVFLQRRDRRFYRTSDAVFWSSMGRCRPSEEQRA